MTTFSPAAQAVFDKTGIPPIGLGTSGRVGDDGAEAVLSAIEAGYRHIDTAQAYGSEAPIGMAIQRSGLQRDEFFLTTKVRDTHYPRPEFLASVERSLEFLGVEQVDLLLLHWPLTSGAVPFESYMEDLQAVKDRGWSRMIGVSNFSIDYLKRAEEFLGKGALTTNQIEIHPYLQNPKMTAYAKAADLTLTAYRPLAEGRVSTDPVLQDIANRHGTSPATVALAFLIAEGRIVIPASTNPQRLRDNLAAQTLELSEEEIGRMRRLDRGERFINPAKAPTWDD